MKRVWFLTTFVLLTSMIFAGVSIKITSESTIVDIEESLLIALTLVDSETEEIVERDLTLSADVNIGGFADPEIFFSGVSMKKGRAELIYIAPSVPGKAVLTFSNEELGIEASYTVLVREKEKLSGLKSFSFCLRVRRGGSSQKIGR